MGYNTDFDGFFDLSRALTIKENNELEAINDKDWRDDHSRPDSYSFYCQWCSNDEGTQLIWNGREKFYGYIEWLEWLITNFFKPKHILLNGEVLWNGEEPMDLGKIIVKDSLIEVKKGSITY